MTILNCKKFQLNTIGLCCRIKKIHDSLNLILEDFFLMFKNLN